MLKSYKYPMERNAFFITAMAVVVRMFEKGKLEKTVACKYLEKLNGYGRYADEIYLYYRAIVGCP